MKNITSGPLYERFTRYRGLEYWKQQNKNTNKTERGLQIRQDCNSLENGARPLKKR